MAQEASRSSSFASRWDKICVHCRRRRVKCDGARPKCGACSRSLSLQDCEYADEGQTTRTHMLEEQIANVEARIEELQKSGPSVPLALQNPYSASRHSSSHSRSSSSSSVPLSPLYSAAPSRHSTPFRVPTSALAEVPSIKLEPLIRNFLQHCSQFGFFLNVHRFQEAAKGRSGQRPAPVLLDVVHLWGIHLSGSDEFTAYEASYLSRALHTAVNALSGTHSSNTVLHSIQAEVLLSYYFVRNTRFLEAKYHLSAAVSLVISSGLHRIRSAEPYAAVGRTLAAPRDPIEECERINAFWTVLTLNNCWTVADGSPSNISYTDPNVRIDTPWPLDINSSGLHNQVLPNSNFGTVTAFLGNQPDSGVSVSALHAKAAILFEQASQLAAQYRPNMNNKRQFYASFKSADTSIERFKLSLPTVHSQSSREMIVVHSLAHVATIQLHNPFVADTDASRSRVVTSARTIVANLAQVPLNKFGYIDPIMGTLLMAACQVFVAELARFRRHRPLNSAAPPEERLVIDAIETVLAAMNILAPSCQLINSQLIAMQQLYRGH
ncbi:Fungal-trans domain-containing protein [Mycena venus]|uniref:Fungal-trans domain-containing protein n=1 Tax=Mycena venus TaxID=2733690 RepID=A0A8H6YW47_9AGAR|nr:Fungal-trans domain-containing protein [Mycena venus]